MIVAELHRKITEEGFTPDLEDLLTAEVFGSLKYLAPGLFLRGILEQVRKLNPETVLKKVDLGVETKEMRFSFWPHRTTGEYGGLSVEPDLELSSKGLLIVVECKYRSSLGEDVTQLPREYLAAKREARGREFCILAVTNHHGPPTVPNPVGKPSRVSASAAVSAYLRSKGMRHIDEAQVSGRIGWIGWKHITAAIEDASKVAKNSRVSQLAPGLDALAQDLLNVLYLRGLRGFRSFAKVLADISETPGFAGGLATGLFLGSHELSHAQTVFGGFVPVVQEYTPAKTREDRCLFLAVGNSRDLSGFSGFSTIVNADSSLSKPTQNLFLDVKSTVSQLPLSFGEHPD